MTGNPVRFCGLQLEHRIINASGTFDPIAASRAFGGDVITSLPFSAFVSKTVTVEPRQGNPPPRLWELPSGMMNSIGLPNKGLVRWVEEDLPLLSRMKIPLIANVMGFERDQFSSLVEALGGKAEISALELNVSCPNVETGTIIGSDPFECGQLVSAMRLLTDSPLIVKITPNASDPAAVAISAEAAGADAISLINTVRGLALDPVSRRPWLGGRTGGISGPAIRAASLAQVDAVCSQVKIPVIAMGGVSSGNDAADLIDCGATLVAVGTENFRDPMAAERIRTELESITLVP